MLKTRSKREDWFIGASILLNITPEFACMVLNRERFESGNQLESDRICTSSWNVPCTIDNSAELDGTQIFRKKEMNHFGQNYGLKS